MSKLQDLERELNAKFDQIKVFWDEAGPKYPDLADIPEADRDHVKALQKERIELEKRIVDTRADTKELQGIRSDMQAGIQRSYEPSGGGMSHPPMDEAIAATGKRRVAQSLGSQFVNSSEWQNYYKQIAPVGQIGEQARVQSPKLVLPMGFNALLTGLSDTSGGAFVTPGDSGIYEPLGRRPLTLRDIISVRTTESDIVEFVRQTTRTNNAAPVAEATASSGSSGAKPESDMAYERVTATVRTIANWVAATKRALSDAGQLRGLIDQELIANLEEELEDQLINGTGTGEDFVGLDVVTGTQDQAWDTNMLTTTRKARTLVKTVGRATPTAYVLNPTDWQTIDLLQDNEARYYFGGPSLLGIPRLWGLPVVESEAIPVGWGWVGDWSKIVLWDREQAMISVSDSHLDFFTRNLVAILAEMRAAMGILRPAAFVEMDLTA